MEARRVERGPLGAQMVRMGRCWGRGLSGLWEAVLLCRKWGALKYYLEVLGKVASFSLLSSFSFVLSLSLAIITVCVSAALLQGGEVTFLTLGPLNRR